MAASPYEHSRFGLAKIDALRSATTSWASEEETETDPDLIGGISEDPKAFLPLVQRLAGSQTSQPRLTWRSLATPLALPFAEKVTKEDTYQPTGLDN